MTKLRKLQVLISAEDIIIDLAESLFTRVTTDLGIKVDKKEFFKKIEDDDLTINYLIRSINFWKTIPLIEENTYLVSSLKDLGFDVKVVADNLSIFEDIFEKQEEDSYLHYESIIKDLLVSKLGLKMSEIIFMDKRCIPNYYSDILICNNFKLSCDWQDSNPDGLVVTLINQFNEGNIDLKELEEISFAGEEPSNYLQIREIGPLFYLYLGSFFSKDFFGKTRNKELKLTP